jgi:alpha-ketoglutarate-dependent taurine dioxygenase
MKITKIPGLGRFGVFIDDIDLNNISDEEWMEIGKIHLESLVTIIRGNKLDHLTYYNLMMKWGDNRWTRPLQLYRKYGKPIKELFSERLLDSNDMRDMTNYKRWAVDKRCPGMIRITPKKNERGKSIGIFGDGELYWHSNESGDIAFTPGVSLMGVENMIGSSTGFCVTADWYEKQSDSFKSELNEMILVHNFRTKHREYDDKNRLSLESMMEYDDTQQSFYHKNQCPEDNTEMPLVIKSPGDIVGLHYSLPTIDYIKGMSRGESGKFLKRISEEIFVEEYIYEHKYQSDNDILLFDNSITLHNRSIENGLAPERMGYRIQFDYDKLVGKQYNPFFQEEFKTLREESIQKLKFAMS